jgi:hypothetical protein
MQIDLWIGVNTPGYKDASVLVEGSRECGEAKSASQRLHLIPTSSRLVRNSKRRRSPRPSFLLLNPLIGRSLLPLCG